MFLKIHAWIKFVIIDYVSLTVNIISYLDLDGLGHVEVYMIAGSYVRAIENSK